MGHNGSGKSTLLKTIGGILQPTTGIVQRRGQIAALLELGAGFHPDLTGRENIFMNGSILGLTKKQVAERFDDIVAFGDIGDFIDTQVKFYSSGMYVRLAFSIAVNVDPDILLVDEVLAVGDEAFQQKCDAELIVLLGPGTPPNYPATLRAVCGVQLVTLEGYQGIDLTPFAAGAESSVAVVTFDAELVDWQTLPSVPVAHTELHMWDRHLMKTPRTTQLSVRDVYVGHLTPQGLTIPAAAR